VNYALNEKFDQLSAALQKAGLLANIPGRLLAVFGMLLAGCATNQEATTSPFFPTNTLPGRNGEYDNQISYWNDAKSRGKPRIVVDLEQQRAYFYKGGRIVGISVVSTGREGHVTPPGDFRITQKDLTHVSSIYGDYIDQNGQVVMENVDVTKDPRPRGTFFVGRPCHTSSESMGLSGCTPVICLVIRHHTAVFGCQKKWRFIFFTKPQSVPLWQFIKDRRRVMGPIHLSVTHTYPSVRLCSTETDLNRLSSKPEAGDSFPPSR